MARFYLTPDGKCPLLNLRDGTFLLGISEPGAEMKEMNGIRALAVHPSGQLALLTRAGSGAQIMQLEIQAVWGRAILAESLAGWRALSLDGGECRFIAVQHGEDKPTFPEFRIRVEGRVG